MPMSESSLIAALLAAHDNADQRVEPPVGATLEPAAIARIQTAVCDARGPAAGFKCGRRPDQPVPIMAPIMASRVYADGATIPASHSRLRGVELEIGFRLIAALPSPELPNFSEALRACVEPVVALEIVESRLQDHDQVPASWKLADLQSNGGLVVAGSPATTWPDDLARGSVMLEANGRTLHEGIAPVPGGDAFDTFVAFALHLGEHCGGLRAGQVVITGSLSGVDYLQAGDVVEGAISGLGSVSVRFE